MAITETRFKFPGQTDFYRGKVRDVYSIDAKLIVVASDRISAFDHILPEPIPYKGQVLNQVASHFLEATREIVPNWLEANPHPNVAIGKKCDPLKIEMVIRGYLAGHAWREYKLGKRLISGVEMPEGMRESDPFPDPIITPATKAESGHDEDISKEEIIHRGLVSSDQWHTLETYTRNLFEKGSKMAMDRGLILVDTKYEFGIFNDEILLIDEIHTPDSSRYYYLEGYSYRQKRGQHQHQLSKEFVREWLMANGFQGLEGQVMPEMPEEFIHKVSERYIELFETITGTQFVKYEDKTSEEVIFRDILDYLDQNP